MKPILGIGILVCAPVVQASSFNSLDLLSQSEFAQLTEIVGAATHYKGVTSSEPLGTIGFDVGVSLSYTEIDTALFEKASNGEVDAAGFIIPRVTVHKGLPFGIDLGVSASAIPDTDIAIVGGEIRYALMDGGVATPAIGWRVSYSAISGVDEMDVKNISTDIAISKGLVMFTPYAGIGFVRTIATPNDSNDLMEETIDQEKLFAGVNINLGLNITLEADKTGENTSYSAKVGIRF